MEGFEISFQGMEQSEQNEASVVRELKRMESEMNQILSGSSMSFPEAANIRRALRNNLQNVRNISKEVDTMSAVLSEIINLYQSTERKIVGSNGRHCPNFIEEFWSNYGWKQILSGAGYIGTIYDLISDLKDGKTWRDFTESGIDIYQFLSGAAKTYNNYKKIGNAVGTKTAMTWWIKRITGFKQLGRASVAKNPFVRFANNLTNKTSPFNAQLKNVIDNFKGSNGVGKAVASWGTIVASGVLNWFDNKEEQVHSNGTMTDRRVIAETITETAIETALTYGVGIVVGAAVTTVIGPVAAPGFLVVAASGCIVLSCKLDAPVPCRLDAPDFDVARWGSADCLHQHQQVI